MFDGNSKINERIINWFRAVCGGSDGFDGVGEGFEGGGDGGQRGEEWLFTLLLVVVVSPVQIERAGDSSEGEEEGNEVEESDHCWRPFADIFHYVGVVDLGKQSKKYSK